mgnify:CR=1 FL=1
MTNYIGNKPADIPVSVNDLPTGITNAKLQNSQITINGSAVSLGGSTTIATGTDWQSVVTASTLNAVSGKGYPIDTSSNTCTITMPATPTVGDTIVFVDYARNFGTNKIIINQNSKNFQGYTSPNPEYDTDGQAITCTYIDATKGWIPTVDDDVTFETQQTYTCDFLVLAGGGSGAEDISGGGGAGGLRSSVSATGGGGSTETALQLIPSTVYTITVGAGYPASDNNSGSGSNSSISGSDITDIVSIGGGEAGGNSGYGATSDNGQDGGCGGGARGGSGTGGSGTSGQGYAGGNGHGQGGGGGGGTGAVGVAGASNNGGNGGDGVSNSITGSAVNYGGGGGGGVTNGNSVGSGGAGGGGAGSNVQHAKGTDGSANLGGGGGGGGNSTNTDVSAGGSGVVILRIATSDYSGTTSGSPTVTTDGSHKVIKFTGSGSYTA